MTLHVFGIRHHGPGCARSLIQALDELQPDAIALEAPADSQPALEFAAHAELRPPVAMLLYPADEPARSVVYPLARFSPEWQALRWAAPRNIPVQAMDLPMAHRLPIDAAAAATPQTLFETDDGDRANATRVRTDPIALLAEAAGYTDHELWWEEQIERRQNPSGLFEAILNAMRTIREEFPERRSIDLLREAFMRKTIRTLQKQGAQRIAVICGAWHAPVLDDEAIAGKRPGCLLKEDTARLKKLPKIKTVGTWIPWTYSRLTYRSGYGAGVTSPGWYDHLWQSPNDAPTRWMVQAARLLRDKDLAASAANVVDASRLAETLAALRDLRSPGLQELNDAMQSVFCRGDSTPLKLIRNRLEVGDELGSVPEDTLAVPLAQDLARLQKSLRLKPSTLTKRLDLDLRQEIARDRSQLLHRLLILGIPWGTLLQEGQGISTFHELWDLVWQPEYAITLIEANVWGNTVESAATARVIQRVTETAQLVEMTALFHEALLADLQQAVPALLEQIQRTAALATDVIHLMEAFPALARILRYGDVRGTRLTSVEPILTGMAERILIGLPAACATLSDESAETMVSAISQLQGGLALLEREDLQREWQERLQQFATSPVHGLVRGWCCRTLLEQRLLTSEELVLLTRQSLSPAEQTSQSASWLTGLLRGSGLMLIHLEAVWQVIDEWLSELPEPTFVELLPLVRRAFSGFTVPERRQMGETVKRLRGQVAATPSTTTSTRDIDTARANKVLPVLAQILGVAYDPRP
ncbi:DUF5682 family protein [Planctomicrobium sp. SH664]|uniref:DUF5682 family protein n=1 Tax=Planctomicrobium sp. SH664 TaxID=3448125 RepID=UPI003F5B6E36